MILQAKFSTEKLMKIGQNVIFLFNELITKCIPSIETATKTIITSPNIKKIGPKNAANPMVNTMPTTPTPIPVTL